MSAPFDPQAPDLVRYSRRLGGAVTILVALAVTGVASHLVRSAVLRSFAEQESLKTAYLSEMVPLPTTRLDPKQSDAPLLAALQQWVHRAGWDGLVYVGRFDSGPRWVPAPGARAPRERVEDISWYAGPELLERAPGEAHRQLACRVDLGLQASQPEWLIVIRPAADIDQRLRTLYVLIFVTTSGTMGLLFIALLTVVARGERLRRSALERAERLRRANEEAQAALVQAAKMTALGELAAGIGHEVNNPIAMVSNAVELLADHPAAADPDVRQGLADVREAAERIRKIVHNLSSFSAPQRVDLGPVELAPLIQRTIELAKISFRAGDDISLRVDLPADLPPVLAQDSGLQQVFLNLLNNARYAVTRPERRSDERPAIAVSARVLDGSAPPMVRVEVRDNGIGIAPEALPRVFEPFFTTKPRPEGTGLGLWVSHRIVEGCGGRIRVEPAPGGGTVFAVELPVALDGLTVPLSGGGAIDE